MAVLKTMSDDLALAIQSAITFMAQKMGTNYQRLKLGARFSANRAKRLGNPLMNPPDTKFQEQLEDILTPVKGVSAGVRLANAESFLLTWLNDKGQFIRTPEETFTIFGMMKSDCLSWILSDGMPGCTN